jgi:hypothetical protein
MQSSWCCLRAHIGSPVPSLLRVIFRYKFAARVFLQQRCGTAKTREAQTGKTRGMTTRSSAIEEGRYFNGTIWCLPRATVDSPPQWGLTPLHGALLQAVIFIRSTIKAPFLTRRAVPFSSTRLDSTKTHSIHTQQSTGHFKTFTKTPRHPPRLH